MNPNYKVKVYMADCLGPKTWVSNENKNVYSGKDYAPLLDDLELEIVPLPTTHLNAVYFSDQLRIDLLFNQGGYWCDTDIIHINPIDKFIPPGINIVYSKLDEFHYAIGFLGAVKRSALYDAMMNRRIKADTSDYQTFGINIWEKCFKEYEGYNHMAIPNELLYKYWKSKDKEMIWEISRTRPTIDTSKELGLHFYAGDTRCVKYIDSITEDNYGYNNLLCDYIRLYKELTNGK
jgi:hypothetical protein